jgi:hypothetical protein
VRRAGTTLLLLPVLVAAVLTAAALLVHREPEPVGGACTPVGRPVSVAGAPSGSVGGFGGVQLGNAAAIVEAGRALGVDARGQAIGVMTAMGESSLMVLDRGDAAGPDSRGLFQQRDNGVWGSYAERMDPTISATNFFRALLQVPDWQTLPPTIAAHRTQHNADPYHYARWWDAAVAVLEALSGAEITGLATGTGFLPCTGVSPTGRTTDGWTYPTAGPVTSGFGVRGNPTGAGEQLHAGVDLAPPCDTPILAAAAGVVVRAGPSSGYGNLVVVDHGGGVVTRYGHMHDDGVLVVIGQHVAGGQQIARVGDAGDSTGCHLHFEVLVDGAFTDPLVFLHDRITDPVSP